MRDLFLRALSCESVERPPVWLMRQAGRYLPEYRTIRDGHSFREMVYTPEVAAEVTLQPLRRFDFDAAILFSDILVVSEVLGLSFDLKPGVGPVFERTVRTANEVEELPILDVEEVLGPIFKTIGLLKTQLTVPLIGFCGGPFTVASYLVEGGSSRDLKVTKQWMFRDGEGFHSLLKKITDVSITYLHKQVDAGVDVLQIFESWAQFLAYPQFREFSLYYLSKIIEALRPRKVPIIFFCRGSSVFASDLAELEPTAISLDWQCHLPAMRKQIPRSIALQGNLDPDILYAPKETIKKEVRALLEGMEGSRGYIFNLGHGMKPDFDPEAVHVLVEAVRG